MIQVFKSFTFDSSHDLDGSGLHGHTYEATIWVVGPLIDGYVLTEAAFESLVQVIRGKLDHKHLNIVLLKPTSENIAEWIYKQAVAIVQAPIQVTKVTVYRQSCKFGAEFIHHV